LSAFGQDIEVKSLISQRIDQKITIDGVFDEPEWINANVASGFTTFEPTPGLELSQKSDVKFLYDDKSIYVAAYLYDSSPDSILVDFQKEML